MKKRDGSYSKKRYQCPDCSNIMMAHTLKNTMTPFQLGEWTYSSIRVWNAPHNKFYERLDMDKIYERVKQHGMWGFWDGWKHAKSMNREYWIYIVDNAYKHAIHQSKLVA
jgi:hypothetical protein